jgi:3-oxoacyl-[acyl-carrier protein] reductase
VSRVLVTGASRGIGRAVAELLIARGHAVAALARDRAGCETIAGARAIGADLIHAEDAVDRAAAALGGLDAVVHAAGVAKHAPIDAIDERDLEDAWALHVRAALRLTRDAARMWRGEARGGSIVHVASTLASSPAPSTLSYAASKAALVALTKTAALELAPFGVRVNAVAPGVVETDMTRGRDLDALRALHPLGRLGTPGEVADAIVFVLFAEWMTGSIVTIDGGLTLGRS